MEKILLLDDEEESLTIINEDEIIKFNKIKIKNLKKRLEKDPMIYKCRYKDYRSIEWPEVTELIQKKNFKGFGKTQIRIKSLRIQVPLNKTISLDLSSIPCVETLVLVGKKVKLKNKNRTLSSISIFQQKDNELDLERKCPNLQNIVSNKKLYLSNGGIYFVKYRGEVRSSDTIDLGLLKIFNFDE